MADLGSIYNETLAYFMTEYAADEPAARLDDRVRAFLADKYTVVTIAAFLDTYLDRLRKQLVDEFNGRFDKQCTLRFRFLDDIGDQIAGIGATLQVERLEFQDALNALSPTEFEALSAYVLKICGCSVFWKTPDSHDQGIDAFGYMPFLDNGVAEWIGAQPRVVFLAQAKHFRKTQVGSKEIRELIGSYELALYQIFSTVDKRYQDLELLPFGPTGLIFMTTEEVPHTVKRMAIRAGVIVLSSDDLFNLLLKGLSGKPKQITKSWIIQALRAFLNDIPTAK